MNIKAIETKYKGYRFRSRLEARWAVMLDSLGIKWEYEPEGYVIDDKTWYLPDFYLPDCDTWLEIKPKFPTNEELNKVASLIKAENTKEGVYAKPCYIGIGTPGVPKISITFNRASKSSQYHLNDGCVLLCLGLLSIQLCAFAFVNVETEPKWDISYLYTNGTMLFNLEKQKLEVDLLYKIPANKMTKKQIDNIENGKALPDYTGLCYPISQGGFGIWYQGDGRDYTHPDLIKAYDAARSARFEFGETPDLTK